MIDGYIDVETADVPLVRVRYQKLRNPSADQDRVVVILAQKVGELYEDGARGFHGLRGERE